MKVIKTLTVLTVLALFVVSVASGQPGLPDPPDQTPIDSGFGILAATGGAYALKKLRDKKEA